MNIGTVYTLYGRRAGAELYFEKIIQEVQVQAEQNLKFFIFCNRDAKTQLEKLGVKNAIYVPELNNQYRKALWLMFQSGSAIQKLKIDCFWIPSGTNHFPGNWKIPSVVTFHDFGEYHVPNKYGLIRTFYRKQICIKRSITNGSVFTSVSKATADDLLRIWGKSSRVIYSGPSPHDSIYDWNSRSDAIEFVHEECGVRLDAPFLLTPGRTDFFGKGIDNIVEASKSQKFQFILCGPKGEGHDKFEALAQSRSNIIYLGRVSTRCLGALLFLCNGVLFASRFEGFGFPVLEAFLYGRPLIVSNGGALPEVVGTAGITFTAGNSQSLIEALDEFAAMPEEKAQQLIASGKRRLEDFSWKKTIDEMIQVFESQRQTR